MNIEHFKENFVLSGQYYILFEKLKKKHINANHDKRLTIR